MDTSTTGEHSAVVESAIKGISHIATLPEITLKIIELVEDPTSTAQDLHNIISHDPALCSRILKVVNSAFYGLPRQIGSINRAIVLLGLNAVKNIAIAASLAKLFRGGDLCPKFAARDLWIHSVATAAASKLICDELHLGLPDEAFLAGLIHDIGIMVEMQAERNGLIQVFDAINFDDEGNPDRDMREVEQTIFGPDHCAFGAGLCETWKFPKSFAFVTGFHHNPMELPPGSRTLACVVYVADRLAGQVDQGFRGDLQFLDIDPDVCEELGLSEDSIGNICRRLPEAIDEVQATFA
ncbi:MAG: HDOD domain-containing protein [Phycisphaerales bacterium]|nr:MAG: HDOD domain-containing protein [Phycisphaerales bacterium]